VPGGPTTTPPTQAQMNNQNSCIGFLNFANDAVSQAIISHNFNLAPSDISQGYPWAFLDQLDLSAYGAAYGNVTSSPSVVLLSQNPDYTVYQKANLSLGGASVPQFKFNILRPFSAIR
jgi:hypothetical protein